MNIFETEYSNKKLDDWIVELNKALANEQQKQSVPSPKTQDNIETSIKQ